MHIQLYNQDQSGWCLLAPFESSLLQCNLSIFRCLLLGIFFAESLPFGLHEARIVPPCNGCSYPFSAPFPSSLFLCHQLPARPSPLGRRSWWLLTLLFGCSLCLALGATSASASVFTAFCSTFTLAAALMQAAGRFNSFFFSLKDSACSTIAACWAAFVGAFCLLSSAFASSSSSWRDYFCYILQSRNGCCWASCLR